MIIFYDDDEASKHKYRIAIISSIRPFIFSAKKSVLPIPNVHKKSELKRYAKEEIQEGEQYKRDHLVHAVQNHATATHTYLFVV